MNSSCARNSSARIITRSATRPTANILGLRAKHIKLCRGHRHRSEDFEHKVLVSVSQSIRTFLGLGTSPWN